MRNDTRLTIKNAVIINHENSSLGGDMKKSESKISLKRFWGENWVEILAVLAVILGIVLIKFERSWLTTIKDILLNWFGFLKNLMLRFNTRFSLTDLVGGFVVLAGILFVLWRIRYRLGKSQRWRSRACPRCGSTLHRVHRTTLDRFIGFLVLPHSRRFRCDNPDCRWTGLLYGRHHAEAAEKDFPVSPGPLPN
jgi:hypothetical protein